MKVTLYDIGRMSEKQGYAEFYGRWDGTSDHKQDLPPIRSMFEFEGEIVARHSNVSGAIVFTSTLYRTAGGKWAASHTAVVKYNDSFVREEIASLHDTLEAAREWLLNTPSDSYGRYVSTESLRYVGC